jgi:recombination protein RecA
VKLAFSKAEVIESELAHRFGPAFKLREKPTAEVISTGVPDVDRIAGGFPRGAITEILGPASSGRTSLLHSALAASTARQEVCALVDACDTFDATSAAYAGTDFDQLLWIRCGSKADHAIKATDLLLQSGGFGLVALDFGDVPSVQSRRVQLSWWFRFKRAIENTPTALIVISRDPNARSCASLSLALNRENVEWSRPSISPDAEERLFPTCSNLLDGFRLHVERCKPVCLDEREARFEARVSYKLVAGERL